MRPMHEGFDGQKQRTALSAAEQALRALGTANADKARKAATKASDLDQIGIYSGLAAAVAPLADRLDRGESIGEAGWDSLVETLGLGPLSGLIDELRS